MLSLGLLLFTLYEFVVTKPFKQQDGAEFLLDKTLLEHAPLLNFIINIAVSMSFILFIGYKRIRKVSDYMDIYNIILGEKTLKI